MSKDLLLDGSKLAITWTTVDLNETLWNSFGGDVYLNTQDITFHVVFKIYTFEITSKSPRDNELMFLKITSAWP